MVRSSCLILGALLAVAPATADAFDPAQKAEIETIVRNYLLENPELIQEVIQKLQERQAAQQAAMRRAAVAANEEALFRSPRQIVLGDPNAKIAFVEFFDYNCGYCRQALADMQVVLRSERDVKIILKEFPILSQGSLDAARVSIAAYRLDRSKYLDLHARLLAETGGVDQAKALAIAAAVGFDAAALQRSLNDDEVTATIRESHELAAALGVTGTPSYVIGRDVVSGAVGVEALKARIEQARAAGAQPGQ